MQTKNAAEAIGEAVRDIDQKAAIMIVIEHLGNIKPGTRCSAVFFDHEKIRKQREFNDRLFSENGVDDPEVRHAMVDANVPSEPFWLVSLKSADATAAEVTHLYRVDALTGRVLPDPA